MVDRRKVPPSHHKHDDQASSAASRRSPALHPPELCTCGLDVCERSHAHDKLHARSPSLPPMDGAAPRAIPQWRGDERAGAELPTLHTLHRVPLAVMPAHCTTSVPTTASMLVPASAAAVAVSCTAAVSAVPLSL